MLEKIDLNKKLSKEERKQYLETTEKNLTLLQRRCRELDIPIVILFEGVPAAGKGTLINKLIIPFDPRGFKVFSTLSYSNEEELRPYMWRFWTKTPANGRIHILDRSWYQKIWHTDSKKESLDSIADEINRFEKLLLNSGTVILKFFLHISKEEQKNRFLKLEKEKETSWKVTKEDWEQNKHYDAFLKTTDSLLVKTNTDIAPWNIIESTNKNFAEVKIKQMLEQALLLAIKEKETSTQKNSITKKVINEPLENKNLIFTNKVLQHIDLNHSLNKEAYKEKLKILQKKLFYLHYAMYQKQVPVILAFEGWDAAGKGGAIKRVTEALDPRGYEVVPISAPNDEERAHHYLWRFWKKIPKNGHMTIFDRTWYGRVLVERIEGFSTEEEWNRAYYEINDFEEYLTHCGCIILKFWLQIDKEEQERRFKARQEIPEKQWKITEEDWRNRAKWDEYEIAINEMITKTSTQSAPWNIIEANSKYYARIQVLETIIQALEKRV